MKYENIIIYETEDKKLASSQTFIHEIPAYISEGEEHTLDIARVFQGASSAILVDCVGNGQDFNELSHNAEASQVHVEAWKSIHRSLTSAENIEQIPWEDLPTFQCATLTESALRFKAKGSGAIYALRMLKAKVSDQLLMGIEPSLVYLGKDGNDENSSENVLLGDGVAMDHDGQWGQVSNNIDTGTSTGEIIGYVLITDGMMNLSLPQVTEVTNQSEETLESLKNRVGGWIHDIFFIDVSSDFGVDNTELEKNLLNQLQNNLKSLDLGEDALDDATMVINIPNINN